MVSVPSLHFGFCSDVVNQGCNELIFNPLIHWWRKGPITKQLRTFMWSNAPVHYKIGMMSCEYQILVSIIQRLICLFVQTCSRTVGTDCSCRVTAADRYGPTDALSGAFFLSTMNYFLLGWNLAVCRGEYVSRENSDAVLGRSTITMSTVLRSGWRARSSFPARATSASRCSNTASALGRCWTLSPRT